MRVVIRGKTVLEDFHSTLKQKIYLRPVSCQAGGSYCRLLRAGLNRPRRGSDRRPRASCEQRFMSARSSIPRRVSW